MILFFGNKSENLKENNAMKNIFTDGVDMSSQRSLLRALGWTDEEMKKPIVGVISAQSDIIPGHMHLDLIAKAVCEGVIAAGGKPVFWLKFFKACRFCAITAWPFWASSLEM